MEMIYVVLFLMYMLIQLFVIYVYVSDVDNTKVKCLVRFLLLIIEAKMGEDEDA